LAPTGNKLWYYNKHLFFDTQKAGENRPFAFYYFCFMIFKAADLQLFKQQALHWAASFDVACYLDSNQFNNDYKKFECLVAAGAKHQLYVPDYAAFEQLEHFVNDHPRWLFGFLTYDLKNEIELLGSSNHDGLNFPQLYFFEPEHLILIRGDEIEILSAAPEKVFEAVYQQEDMTPAVPPQIKLRSRFTRSEYIDTVKAVKDHINRGDIYVTNFCQEFYAEDAFIDPLSTFIKLNAVSPNPFAAFFKLHSKYILCASPERFLAKRGKQLISQPIKGTARRDDDPGTDEAIKQDLKNTPKELQENVMIVDLVRNDLTRSARQGTVKAEKLFEIQSYTQVHQMVSTVTCELDAKISTVEAIKNTFPMGSMTGAPKVSSLELMEYYERTKRGVYSGAIGYFSPDNDFDFNVVIRSILYNAKNNYLSFQVGSAITYHADPEKEYEECLLKAKAILEALGQAEFFPQS